MLTSPSGKSYIGQTIRPIEKRFEEHRNKRKGCVALYNAIKFHGWVNFEKDWYECPDEDLNFDEELLIQEMGTLSPDGYNLREGGGNRGKPSEESKRKMSEARRGKTLSEDHKKKMSEVMKGEKNHMYGKNHVIDSIQKMRNAKCGEKNPNFEKTGEKHHNSKRVYQYSLDGIFIDSFGSTREAERHLKKNGTGIRSCALGKNKTAYGFKWSYTEQ